MNGNDIERRALQTIIQRATGAVSTRSPTMVGQLLTGDAAAQIMALPFLTGNTQALQDPVTGALTLMLDVDPLDSAPLG